MVDDLMHMQRQAARRVQRMQEHSRQMLEQYGEPQAIGARHWPGDTPVRLTSPGLYERTAPTEVAKESPPLILEEETSQPAALPMDTEQWFLLGLALLLFRSGCRPELALSLLYLAM